MWRKESWGSDDEGGAEGPRHAWLATLTMDMTEEEYHDMPRSTKAERKAAKAIDRLKCGCAPHLLRVGGRGGDLGLSHPARRVQHLRGICVQRGGKASAS